MSILTSFLNVVMKVTQILLICFLMTILFAGCSTSQNTAGQNNMQVINATFKHWSHAPSVGSDIPERGTDLRVTIKSWPEYYSPEFIVFNSRKSMPAEITRKDDSIWVITARIIRSSDKLSERSEKMDVSNRLVYSDTNGEEEVLEIFNWQQAEE